MRVGIDANPLRSEHMTGIPVYIDALVRQFLENPAHGLGPEHLLLVARVPVSHLRACLERHGVAWRDVSGLRIESDLYDVRLAPRFPGLARPPLGWVTRKVDGRLLEPINRRLAARVRPTSPVDVFHWSGDGGRPHRVPGARRNVLTIHDLTPRLFPETHDPHIVENFEHLCAFARNEADFLIADSEATRCDAIEHLGIAPDRIRAVPLAARDALLRAVPDETVRAVGAKFGLDDRRYVLAGGSLEPRKNLPRLIAAFALLAREPDMGDVRLVLAGARQRGAGAVEAAVSEHGLTDKVVLTGFVTDAELAALMRGAACFAYVSLYEGFGLPVLEAMAQGPPVVTSKVSSLPEVAGDAALLVDPYEPESIADGMRRVLTDANLAASLREKGAARAGTFSWERTAAEHVRVYREVAG